jgi:hypothetical protein
MSLYADAPVRRTVQLAGDLLVAAWVGLWIKIGLVVHDLTDALAKPGEQIEHGAGAPAGKPRDAGDAVGKVPLVGDAAGKPFEGAGGAADQLAAAGRAQAEAVHTLAFWLGLIVALIPILIVLAIHLPLRIRFYRRARAGQKFLDSADDLDLFALRAMTNQPLHVLARVSDDPTRGWREGDPTVVRRLAELELRDVGLRVPASL